MAYRQAQAGSISQRSGTRLATGTTPAGPPEATDALATAKAVRVSQLWFGCDAYEKQFFSAGAHALILEAKLAGNQKAIRLRQWVMGLWRDYYFRKDAINEKSTVAEVNNVDINMATFGKPPYSIREIVDASPAI